jgi:hypothetical protein
VTRYKIAWYLTANGNQQGHIKSPHKCGQTSTL